MAPRKLGIIAGGGGLPREIIAHCRDVGREVFVLAFPGETDPETVESVPHVWSRLGAVGGAIRRLRSEGVQDLVMAGAIRRPSFSSVRPDWRATRMIAKLGLRALGDDGLLSMIVRELEGEGFTLVGADSLLGDALALEGVFGAFRPDEQALADVTRGVLVATALGALDVGQAVVVQQGLVLGVEAIEGTDALIRRCGPLARGGARPVLVKAKKPDQERRADLPAIGKQTVSTAAEMGFAGIAIEAGATIVIGRGELVHLANHHKLFIYGFKR